MGMAWSVLSPLLTLLVMKLVFGVIFARGLSVLPSKVVPKGISKVMWLLRQSAPVR